MKSQAITRLKRNSVCGLKVDAKISRSQKKVLAKIFRFWRAKRQNAVTCVSQLRRILGRKLQRYFRFFSENSRCLAESRAAGVRLLTTAMTGHTRLRGKDALHRLEQRKFFMQASDQAHYLVAAAKLIGTLTKIVNRKKVLGFARMLSQPRRLRSKAADTQTEGGSPSQQDLDGYAEIVRKMEERIHLMEIERAALLARLAATKEDMRLLVSRSLDVSTVNSLGG